MHRSPTILGRGTVAMRSDTSTGQLLAGNTFQRPLVPPTGDTNSAEELLPCALLGGRQVELGSTDGVGGGQALCRRWSSPVARDEGMWGGSSKFATLAVDEPMRGRLRLRLPLSTLESACG
jgi:hypothetical protein